MVWWGQVHDRVFHQDATDLLCAELRRSHNERVLCLALGKRVVHALRTAMRAGGLVHSAALRGAVYAHLLHGLPRAQELANVVLRILQRFERPHVERQAQLVCAHYAWAIIFDASGGPQHRCRARTGWNPRASLKVYGTFSVPLLPNIYVKSEKVLHAGVVLAYIVHLMRMSEPEALPLAWVDDCTEHTFLMSATAIARGLHAEVLAGVIVVDRMQKKIDGFFEALDFKHVHWRLEDKLRRGSLDFPKALEALQCLMRKWDFEEEEEEEEGGGLSADGDALEAGTEGSREDGAEAADGNAPRRAARGRQPSTVAEVLELMAAGHAVHSSLELAAAVVEAHRCNVLHRAMDGAVAKLGMVCVCVWKKKIHIGEYTHMSIIG